MSEPSKLIQAEIDIPKFVEQRRLLDETEFSKLERNGVGRHLLKLILNRIGTMRECVESQKTLARVFNVQRETINLAINRLTALDIITKERRWNERYGKVLNHYRINWTELARRLNRSSSQIEQRSQCEDSPGTNVSIQPNQCEVLSGTNVRIHPDRNTEPNSRETTTTKPDWESVVFLLSTFGVSQGREAIDRAKARNATPTEVKRIIERIANDPNIDESKRAGAMYNQVCNPTPEPEMKPREPKRKRPNREIIRQRVALRLRNATRATQGTPVSHEDRDAEIERITDESYKQELGAYEESRCKETQHLQHSIGTESLR